MAETKDVASNVKSVSSDEEWETVVEPYGETFSFEKPGDTLVGTYVTEKVVQTDDLNNPGELRDQTVYEIQDADGKKWSVWSSYMIEQGMNEVKIGSLVRIRFTGKTDIDGGKRTVKQFEIATRK